MDMFVHKAKVRSDLITIGHQVAQNRTNTLILISANNHWGSVTTTRRSVTDH